MTITLKATQLKSRPSAVPVYTTQVLFFEEFHSHFNISITEQIQPGANLTIVHNKLVEEDRSAK